MFLTKYTLFFGKVEQTKKLKGHSGDVYALELLADGGNSQRLGNLVSGGDYTLKTWNIEVLIYF